MNFDPIEAEHLAVEFESVSGSTAAGSRNSKAAVLLRAAIKEIDNLQSYDKVDIEGYAKALSQVRFIKNEYEKAAYARYLYNCFVFERGLMDDFLAYAAKRTEEGQDTRPVKVVLEPEETKMIRDWGFGFPKQEDAERASNDLLSNGFITADAQIWMDEESKDWSLAPVYGPHEPYSQGDLDFDQMAEAIASKHHGFVTGTGVAFPVEHNEIKDASEEEE